MEDFKIILYILAAVAYFLFTQWRKAFSAPEQEEEERPKPKRVQQQQPQQPPRPVTSFEDILRELQPKMEQDRAEPIPAREFAREVTPAPLATATESTTKYKSYEQAAPKILSWEKKAEAIEAQKRSMERRQPVFKAYNQEKAPESRYAKLLRNPTTVKDAVILTEILKRKF
ncbi:hypothetical protein [Pontibacter sp. H249]|uniref:hypothetical protein n=1 Tax=Pontibacter sp. H249 TaxID=3133420 RepID=UPI0030BDA72B